VSSVTPKSLFELLFWNLFNASLNNALCASSLLNKKSIVALTSISSIWRYKYSYTTLALYSDTILDS